MKNLSSLLTYLLVLTLSVKAQVNMTLLSQKTYSTNLSNLWGYTDVNGREYALVGVSNGLSIVDVTSPTSPVEIQFFLDSITIWREVKAWEKHAFVVSDNNNAHGLMIVDMTNLPVSATYVTHYQGVMYPFSSTHTISIDENGIGYLFGSDYGVGGAIVLDLNDPQNPIELGVVDEYYIHDGFVRGDTLWASSLYGLEVVYDMSDKSNPVKIAEWSTPHNFTHSSTVSDDGQYVFTTDELSGAFITAYDVSDLSNIEELDRYQSNPGSGSIPHNPYYLNGYVITSYYTDGVTVIDASRPHNLIEVGNYDSSPNFFGDGFHGNWGVYPYFPSGNIILSDIENGLFVLGPNYQRACYLEGLVTDSICGTPLHEVKIRILGTPIQDKTSLIGKYATGYVVSGNYTVEFSKPGYQTRVIPNVQLSNGVLTTIDVKLYSSNLTDLNGVVLDASGLGIANASVLFKNDTATFSYTTDANGQFEQCNFITGLYDVYIGKWGYENFYQENMLLSGPSYQFNQNLNAGYQDNFMLDLGWNELYIVNWAGFWNRAVPVGTFQQGIWLNPSTDDSLDAGDKAYVIEAALEAGEVGQKTTLISPPMDLSLYAHPYLEYSFWYATLKISGYPYLFNDYLKIKITNGIDTVLIDQHDTTDINSRWVFEKKNLENLINYSLPVQILVETEDIWHPHLLEVGFDHFRLFDSVMISIPELSEALVDVYPNPSSGLITFKNKTGYIKTLILRDITGKQVLKQEIGSSSDVYQVVVDVSPGIYFIQLIDYKNQKIADKKWVKF